MKEKVKVQDVTVGLVCPLQTWLCAGAGKNPPCPEPAWSLAELGASYSCSQHQRDPGG